MRKLCIVLFALSALTALCPAGAPQPGEPLTEIYDKIADYQHKKFARIVAKDPSLRQAASLSEMLFRLTIEEEKILARYLVEHPKVKAYIDPIGLPIYVIVLPKIQNDEILRSENMQRLRKQVDDVLAELALEKANDERLTKAMNDDKGEAGWAQVIEYIKPRFADAVVRYGNE